MLLLLLTQSTDWSTRKHWSGQFGKSVPTRHGSNRRVCETHTVNPRVKWCTTRQRHWPTQDALP